MHQHPPGVDIGRFVDPLGELADGAEVGLVSPIGEPRQLQVLEHALGERREGDAFPLGGSRRGANGSLRIGGTTCHETVLLNRVRGRSEPKWPARIRRGQEHCVQRDANMQSDTRHGRQDRSSRRASGLLEQCGERERATTPVLRS
jgi:hypothetical protein